MKIFNIIIVLLGAFAALRLLVGLLLSNTKQIKRTDRVNHYNGKKSLVDVLLNLLGIHRHFAKHGNNVLPKDLPTFSVVIPAFNEEKTIYDCVYSVINQTYQKRQVIVVDDGSTDRTGSILDEIKSHYINDDRIVIVHKKNGGKSTAINEGVKKYATGELVTVLDSDSTLNPNALEKMSSYFTNPKVLAIASNVRINKPHKFIEYVQQMEYLLGYRLKGSEEILGLEYIIGGIGSTFRRWAMKEVGYYDTDTVTEDIDFTMKLLNHFGNRSWKFGYANDVIAYTPAVHYFNQLLKQRYRWKYGRFKALFKYKNLLFNKDFKKYSLTLPWWKLPKVFFEEFMMFVDPLMVIWIFYLMIQYYDMSTVITLFALYFVFGLFSLFPENLPKKQKIKLILLSPFTIALLYVINLVDYISLIHCLKNMHKIIHNTDKSSGWIHVER